MSRTKVQTETIQSIVEKSKFSPSPDNCQPWEFEWNGEMLSVFHLSGLSKHPLNPGNLASILALGCLLESIDLAASEFRLKTVCEVGMLDPGDRARWVNMWFERSTGEVDPLAEMVSKRTTDRRTYQGGSEVLDTFALPQNSSGAQVHKITKITPDIMEYVVKTELFLTDHQAVLPAIMKWVRFSMRHARESADGLSWRNMLVKIWEVPSMMIIRSFPATARLFRPFVRKSHASRTKSQLLSSAGIICVSVKLKDGKIFPRDLVDAGRLSLRTWLKLTEFGFGAQPLSFSTLPLIYRRTGNDDDFFKSQSLLIVEGEEVLRRHFSIAPDRLPVWMYRTGMSPDLPPEMRTFRKPAKLTLV